VDKDAGPRISLATAASERQRVLAYDQVLEEARTMFLEQMTVNMQELARRLTVSRATLYRVASSRERVLGDVIWSLSILSLRSVARHTTEPIDLGRVLRIGERFRDIALDSEPMKRFVAEEPSTAAAVLHTRSAVRDQLVDEWKNLLIEATTDSPLSIHPKHAAEIIVSLGASMLYGDLVTGERSDPDLVAVVLRSLFR
jgi:hypothetical protein